MYTLSDLQQRLEKAKDTLREVEDHLHKVNGKPSGNSALRYGKQDRGWHGPTHPPDDEGPARRRIFDFLGEEEGAKRRRVDHEKPSRRRVVEEGSTRRRVSEAEGPSRRRPFADGEDRKRMFRDDDSENDEEDTSPVRKKSFQSVVGKVQLPDLSVSLKRGRERREREGQSDNHREGPARPRNIFARLSGLASAEYQEPQEEEDYDEDDRILKRQPTLSSRVLAIEQPAPSREQVMDSQKQDEARKSRDRRMFGALLGTLQQFRREETQVKEKEERRQQIEKKLEDDARREKERMQEEKRSLQIERKRREADIKRIEWSLNRVKEFATWETSVLPLKKFIQTKSLPHIFYMPKRLNSKTEEALKSTAITVQEMIDKRLTTLNEEIEASEIKARRVVGEIDNDINKENEELKGEKAMHGRDEEIEESVWEEVDGSAGQLELKEAHVDTTAKNREVVVGEICDRVDNDETAEKQTWNLNGGDKTNDDVTSQEGEVLAPDSDPLKEHSFSSSLHLSPKHTSRVPMEATESPISKTVEIVGTEKLNRSVSPTTVERDSVPLKTDKSQTGEVRVVPAAATAEARPRPRSASQNRSRSRSTSDKPGIKKNTDRESKSPEKKAKHSRSRSSSRKLSLRSKDLKRLSPVKRHGRSSSPRKRSERSNSRSNSKDVSKRGVRGRLDKRRSRSLSKKRASPGARRQRRSRSRSGGKRSRSRSPRKSSRSRRRGRSRSGSSDRRRRSRSGGRLSPRKRSLPRRRSPNRSPARTRKHSTSSCSSVSSTSSSNDSD